MFTSQKIVKVALVIMVATFLSRISGLARLMIITYKFGSGIETDAFWAAFTVPNMLRELLAEGALSVAFIPVFVQYLTTMKEESWKLASIVLNFLIIFLLLIVFLGVIGAKWYVPIFFPGFRTNLSQLDLTIKLTQVMFPFIAFIALAALVMGILNAKQHFVAPAFAPLIFNLFVIGAILFLTKKYGIYSIAIGVIIGGLGQFLIQLPVLFKKGLKYSFFFNYNHPGFKKVLQLLIPAVLLALINQIRGAFIPRFFASGLEGGISALQWARIIIWFPLGIFAVAISTAIFPTLSAQAVKKDIPQLKKTLSLGLRMVFSFTIPASVGLFVLRVPIIRLLLERGKFSAVGTEMAAQALAYYTLGLFALGGVLVLMRVFYAFQDMKTPLKVGSGMIFLNILFSFWFLPFLKHGGLALATSLANIINIGILLFILKRRLGDIDGWRITESCLKVMVASVFMGICCFRIAQGLEGGNQFIQVFSAITGGLVILIVFSFLLKIEEMKLAWAIVQKKFKK